MPDATHGMPHAGAPESAPIRSLAEAVRCHVPVQPWSRYGDDPVPVEMSWDGKKWAVRFVTAVSQGRRQWKTATGTTPDAALDAARRIQRGETRP
jgi:hypothetical protein